MYTPNSYLYTLFVCIDNAVKSFSIFLISYPKDDCVTDRADTTDIINHASY